MLEDWGQPPSTFFLPNHPRDFERLTLARIFIEQGNLEDALELLEWLFHLAETAGRTGSVVEILILEAIAWHALGDDDQAFSALERAIVSAERGGYIRLFADEGPSIVELLHRARDRDIAPEYVDKLISACEVGPGPKPQADDAQTATAQSLVDPISDRELEILNLIADGMSNREAAGKLIVATSTVKKHLENIYGKLGVHNRTRAVACARDLNLL